MKYAAQMAGIALLVAVIGCQTTTKEYDDYQEPQSESHSYLETQLKKLETKAAEYPKVPEYQYQIAAVHFQRGDYRDAAAFLENAIYLDPSQSRYRYHLGRCHLRMGELEAAEADFRQAISLSQEGRFSGLHASFGYVLALRGNFAAAKTELEKAIAIDPDEPEPYYFLGAVHDLEKQSDRAIFYLREYLDHGGSTYRERAIKVLQQLGVTVDQSKLPPARAPGSESPEALGGEEPTLRGPSS